MANKFPRERLERIVAWADPILKEFDVSAIAATGHSGLVVGGALTYATGIPLLAVRRESDRPIGHVTERVSGINLLFLPHKGYVFIDDFIAWGRTLENVQHVLKKEVPSLELKAILLYSDRKWRGERQGIPLIGEVIW